MRGGMGGGARESVKDHERTLSRCVYKREKEIVALCGEQRERSSVCMCVCVCVCLCVCEREKLC